MTRQGSHKRAIRALARQRNLTYQAAYNLSLQQRVEVPDPDAAPLAEIPALGRALGGVLAEHVLFGIGGGSGFGRFPYGEQVTLLTRITTTESRREGFLAGVCERLGVAHRMSVASGDDALKRALERSLAAGNVPIVWVAAEALPWPGPVASYQAVAVLSLDSGSVTCFDGNQHQLEVGALLMAAASPPGVRRRWLELTGPPMKPLSWAINAGLAAHVDQMRNGFGPASVRRKFGLQGLRDWAATVTGDDRRLAEQIMARGGGPAMRVAHARFLEEAGHPAAAASTLDAATAWAALAARLAAGTGQPADVEAVALAEEEALARLSGIDPGLSGASR